MKENLLTSMIHYDLLRSPNIKKNRSNSLAHYLNSHNQDVKKQTKIYLQYEQVQNYQKSATNKANNSQNDLNQKQISNNNRIVSLQKINKLKNHALRQQSSSSEISKKRNFLSCEKKDKKFTQNFLSFIKRSKQKRKNYTQMSQMQSIYIQVQEKKKIYKVKSRNMVSKFKIWTKIVNALSIKLVSSNLKEFSMKQLVLNSLKDNIKKSKFNNKIIQNSTKQFKKSESDLQRQCNKVSSIEKNQESIIKGQQSSEKKEAKIQSYSKQSKNPSIMQQKLIQTTLNHEANSKQQIKIITNKIQKVQTLPNSPQKYKSLNPYQNSNLISQMIKYRQKIDRFKARKQKQYQSKNKLGIKITKIQSQKSSNIIKKKSKGQIFSNYNSNFQVQKNYTSFPQNTIKNEQMDCIIPPQDDIFQFNDSITKVKVALKLPSPMKKIYSNSDDQSFGQNNSSNQRLHSQHTKLSQKIKRQKLEKQRKKLLLSKSKQFKNSLILLQDENNISKGLLCLCLDQKNNISNDDPKIIVRSLTSQKDKISNSLQQNQNHFSYAKKYMSLSNNNAIVLNSFNCFMISYMQMKKKENSENIFSEERQKSFFDSYKEINKIKKNQFYYYYVGNGNNQSLIIQQMKKRKNWKLTNNMQKANFIWTQLKVSQLFKKSQFSQNILRIISQSIQKSKNQQQIQTEILSLEKKKSDYQQFVENISQFHNQNQANKSLSSSISLKLALKKLQKLNQQNQAKILNEMAVERQLTYICNQKKKNQLKERILLNSQQKIRKIYHQSQIESKLRKIFYFNEKSILTQSRNFKSFINLNPIFQPNFIHNHFQESSCIGNKKQLLKILTLFQLYSNKKITQKYIPLSFHIQSQQDSEYEKFLEYFTLEKQESKSSIWILKPGQNSNRGHGIMLTRSLYQIKSIIRQKSKSEKQSSVVIQKYLTKVFLYQKRKFDIRVYMLILSINNQTKFFFYEEGYIRTSSVLYNLQDLDDIYVHLTNDAVQQNHQKYSYYEKGNKLSYHQFQKYLDFNYAKQNYSMTKLHKKMKSIACDIAKASYFKINQKRQQTLPSLKPFGFQLFGLDFIIDQKFKPWLLEVNTNPCLQLKSPILQRLIPRMLENMFRLCLDPLFQKDFLTSDLNSNQNKSSLSIITTNGLQNILDINKWELIHDSLYDQDKNWQQFYKSKQNKQNKQKNSNQNQNQNQNNHYQNE